MASLSSAYFTTEKLEGLLKTIKAKKAKGVDLTISISDEGNQYGNNVSMYVSQSKEEREEKKPRYYVANGKTFWTDGNISVPEKVQAEDNGIPLDSDSDDLLF